MSKAVVESLKETFAYSWGLLDTFIDVCPEEVWVKKFGGWPLWQNVYHALSSIDYFVLQDGESNSQSLYSHTVASLSEVPTGPTPTRQELKALIPVMKGVADAYFGKLTDAGLAGKNEGFSARMNMPCTHAATCSMLAAHTMYHLGICDTALREHGLKGVF